MQDGFMVKKTEKKLHDKIILITGASRGIGRALALQSALQGAKVIAVARTSGALNELDDEVQAMGGEQLSIIEADIAKIGTIEQLMNAIAGRFGRLDGIIGNAAVLGAVSPITHCDIHDIAQTMSCNFMANFEIIKYGDGLLRQSQAGRALFITSSVGANPRAFWGPYAISKAALDNLVLTYAKEILQTNIKVNLINPGAVRTNMRAKAFPGENPETLIQPNEIALQILPYIYPESTIHGQIISVQ